VSFGLNSNVRIGEATYHVQTEAGAASHPFVNTLVYVQGQVLHRRSTSYADLMGPSGLNEAPLRQRVERQHERVVEELQSGDLVIEAVASAPAANPGMPRSSAATALTEAHRLDGRPLATAARLEVKLLNAGSWLVAGRACLKIEVRAAGTQEALADCPVEVELEGARQPARFAGRTDARGCAELSFAMPALEPDGGALIIRASGPVGEHRLRYRLKPKAPARAPVAPAR